MSWNLEAFFFFFLNWCETPLGASPEQAPGPPSAMAMTKPTAFKLDPDTLVS